MQALGVIEVNGYLAAIEAADAALKAANVSLVGIEIVKAGISAVELTGDVGAIKASVDAGKLSAESLGALRSATVIPRIHEETIKVVGGLTNKKGKAVISKESKAEANKEFTLEKNEKSMDLEKSKEISIKDNLGNRDEVPIVYSVNDPLPVEEVKEEIISKSQNKDMSTNKNNHKKKNKDYSSMKVEDLRRMVQKLNIPGLTEKEIKFAKKNALIKILIDKAGEK